MSDKPLILGDIKPYNTWYKKIWEKKKKDSLLLVLKVVV